MSIKLKSSITVLLSLGISLVLPMSAYAAITPIADPSPGQGSYGFQATKTQPPPTQGATISIPSNGATFTTSPITVSGICPSGLLVEIDDNGVMDGAVNCTNGSFSLQVGLYSGQNSLTATVYDDLNQAGPVSNTVNVTYNNPSFSTFGDFVTLTSAYGQEGADPNTVLTWPLQLSGGTGPYAFSIDWGDGSPKELKSQPTSGVVNITHTYTTAGIYHVTVEVTDVNGVSAFLQLVAVANGNIQTANSTAATSSGTIKTSTSKVLLLPTLVIFILLLPSFWLGRRSQAVADKKKHH
jgi:hypothetical protein